jgi:DNA-binding response OmpR family regulator
VVVEVTNLKGNESIHAGSDDHGAQADARRVLVVDDDAQMRQVLQWALEDDGLDVETAADGRAGIELGRARRPGVLILDMTLPVLDGYEVASALREAWGETLPIIMVTGDGRAAQKARELGALAYLRKPFEVRELLLAVQRVFQSEE